jgi:Uma2 family endonuclease
MQRKLKEYFSSGVEMAWIFDPRAHAVAIHRSPGPPDEVLGEADTLHGGTVLPGFELRLAELFAELQRPPES